MASALRRLPLERGILVTVPATILAVACSASWSVGLRSVAHPLRAAGLIALAALSVAYALARPAPRSIDRTITGCAAAFFAVAVVSISWSVDPRHTAARVAAFALLIVTAAALAAAVAGDRPAAFRLLGSVLVGAVLVALAGVAVAAVSPHDAVQAATQQVGDRFRGIGQNPNTAAMLFATALPVAAFLGVETRSGRGRLASAAAFLLLAGSIVASGSRGAAAAACAGLLLFGVVAARRVRPRAAAIAVVAAFALAAGLITAVSAPLSAVQKSGFPTGNTEQYTPNDAQFVLRLEDELGYSNGHSQGRSLLGSSGRVEAWRGAVRQGVKRPVLGYGFGTEEAVFVDRYQDFQGGVPENSFIGLFLQLGTLGLGLFLLLIVALVLAGVRLLRTDRRLASVCLAVLGAGVVLAFVQSYLYVVGNAATIAVWACAFLPAARRQT